jgi:hypothetical protein
MDVHRLCPCKSFWLDTDSGSAVNAASSQRASGSASDGSEPARACSCGESTNCEYLAQIQRKHIHTFTHSHIHTFTHSHIHTFTQTHTHTLSHSHTDTHTDTHTNTHRHRHIDTPTHKHTDTQTHALAVTKKWCGRSGHSLVEWYFMTLNGRRCFAYSCTCSGKIMQVSAGLMFRCTMAM